MYMYVLYAHSIFTRKLNSCSEIDRQQVQVCGRTHGENNKQDFAMRKTQQPTTLHS